MKSYVVTVQTYSAIYKIWNIYFYQGQWSKNIDIEEDNVEHFLEDIFVHWFLPTLDIGIQLHMMPIGPNGTGVYARLKHHALKHHVLPTHNLTHKVL